MRGSAAECAIISTPSAQPLTTTPPALTIFVARIELNCFVYGFGRLVPMIATLIGVSKRLISPSAKSAFGGLDSARSEGGIGMDIGFGISDFVQSEIWSDYIG